MISLINRIVSDKKKAYCHYHLTTALQIIGAHDQTMTSFLRDKTSHQSIAQL